MRALTLTAHYYQQFDADLQRDVPGEGYGGWQQAPLTLDLDHTRKPSGVSPSPLALSST